MKLATEAGSIDSAVAKQIELAIRVHVLEDGTLVMSSSYLINEANKATGQIQGSSVGAVAIADFAEGVRVMAQRLQGELPDLAMPQDVFDLFGLDS